MALVCRPARPEFCLATDRDAAYSMDMSEDGLPTPRRYWSVASVGMAITLTVLDGAIANVALPPIARDLAASPADIVWVVNAYQIAIFCTLLPLAALAETVGYRRVYLTGLAVFTLASLGCVLSRSLDTLILCRTLQGLGAAGVFSINGAITRFNYPSRLLGRGIALNAMIVAVASGAGPSVAAALLALGPWQTLFAVNLPVGLLAFGLAWTSIPDPPVSGRGFDWVSAILNCGAFGLLMIGAEGLARGGGGIALAWAEVATALVALALLVTRSLSRPRPMIPVDLLRLPIFALSIMTSITSFTAQALAYVSLPFVLQYGFGRTEVETGLLMTPWPLGVLVAAPIAGRLADRYPSGLLGGIGLAILAVGLGLLAALPQPASAWEISWRMAVCGVGFGVFQSPNNRTLLTSAPLERAGGAAGMLATARTCGLTIGATLAALSFRLRPDDHGAVAPLAIAAGIAGLAAVVSTLRLAAPARPAA